MSKLPQDYNNKDAEPAAVILHSDSRVFNVESIEDLKNFPSHLLCIVFFSNSELIASACTNSSMQPKGNIINETLTDLLDKHDPSLFGFYVFKKHPALLANDMQAFLKSGILDEDIIFHIMLTATPKKELDGLDYYERQELIRAEIKPKLLSKTALNFVLYLGNGITKTDLSAPATDVETVSTFSVTLREVKKHNESKRYLASHVLLKQLHTESYNTIFFVDFDLLFADLCLDTATEIYNLYKLGERDHSDMALNNAIELLKTARIIFQIRRFDVPENQCDLMIGYCYLALYDQDPQHSDPNYLKAATPHFKRSAIFFQDREEYEEAGKCVYAIADRITSKSITLKEDMLPLKVYTNIQNAKNDIETKPISCALFQSAAENLKQANALLEKAKPDRYLKSQLQNLTDFFHTTNFHFFYQLALFTKKSNPSAALSHLKSAEKALLKSSQKNNYRYRAILNHQMGIFLNLCLKQENFNSYLKKACKFYRLAEMEKKADSIFYKVYGDEDMRERWCRLVLAESDAELTPKRISEIIKIHRSLKMRVLSTEDKAELNGIFPSLTG